MSVHMYLSKQTYEFNGYEIEIENSIVIYYQLL